MKKLDHALSLWSGYSKCEPKLVINSKVVYLYRSLFITMKIKKKRDGKWDIIFRWSYFTIWWDRDAVKIFSELIRLQKEHEVDKQLTRDRISLGKYDVVFIWSRTTKRFFCEIWIDDEKIWSFNFILTKKDIHIIARYFRHQLVEKKEVFEKIMVLYPMPDRDEKVMDKNT